VGWASIQSLEAELIEFSGRDGGWGDLRAIGPPASSKRARGRHGVVPSRQSALPGGCFSQSPGRTRRSCSGFRRTPHGLAARGDRSRECRGRSSRPANADLAGATHCRPGSIRGSAVRTSCHRSPHQPAANRCRPCAPPTQGLPRCRRTERPAPAVARAATRPARRGRPSNHHINEASLGGSGLFRVTASLGQAPQIADASRPCRPGRLPQDRWPRTDRPADQPSKLAPAGRACGVPSPGPGRRRRFPRADAVSPAGRGGGDCSSRHFMGGATHRHTGGPAGPRGGELLRFQGLRQSQLSRSVSGSQL